MAMAPRMAQLTIDAMVPRARLRWQRAFLLVRCRRLMATRLEPIDLVIADDMRAFLISDRGLPNVDVASSNVQRGRDHGLPSYNDVRQRIP